MQIRTIRDVNDLKGKRVFVRADFNVPIVHGVIKDDYKIRQSLLTLQFLIQAKARVVIASHLAKKQSLRNIAIHLSKLLGKKIKFLKHNIGFEAEEAAARLEEGGVLFLENLRQNLGEEKNDNYFAQSLSRLGDIYVNDAFAVSHRFHVSVDKIQNYLSSYSGLLLEHELGSLEKILNPTNPLVLIMGGAKVSTKWPLLKHFYNKTQFFLLGGVLANTFLKAFGHEIGRSRVNSEDVKLIQGQFKNINDKKIILPLDVVVRNKKHIAELKDIKNITRDDEIFDIGPATVVFYSGIIKKAKTLIWNGPMGKFEDKNFKHGTLTIAQAVAARSQGTAFGVVGGGETIEALNLSGMTEYIDWVSTGGGAMLAFLAGDKMPGLRKLNFKL